MIRLAGCIRASFATGSSAASNAAVIAPPAEEEPQVTNLMEALQRSLREAKSQAAPAKTNGQSNGHANGHAKRSRIAPSRSVARVAVATRRKRRAVGWRPA